MAWQKGKPTVGTGRPKGSKNKSTLAKQEAIAKAIEVMRQVFGKDEFKGDSHDLLTLIYKCPEFPFDVRVDAAKACLPYDRVRLNQNTLTNSEGQELSVAIVRFTDAPMPDQTEKKIPLRH